MAIGYGAANFDLKNSFRLWNKYYFLIPRLAFHSSEMEIKNIKFELSGTTLWQKMLKK